MGLQVACPGCSKKLAVNEELLGKKIKCPECQTVLALSAPKTPAPAKAAQPKPASPVPAAQPRTAAPAAQRAAPAAGDKITVACSCGSKLRVPANAAGKKVRCPKCQATLAVGAAAPAAPVATPSGEFGAAPAAAGGFGDGFPAFDQGGLGAGAPAADPFGAPAADPFGAPAADPLGTPAPMAGDPLGVPAAGNIAWDDLPAAGAPTTPAQFPAYSTPAAGAQTGAQRDNAALAAAGAYQPSLEEKQGRVVSQLNQPDGRDWGTYFSSRIHWGILIMMLGGPFVAFLGWQTSQKLAALEAKGVTVPGIIMEGEERRSRRSRSYTFVVQYETEDGNVMTEDFSVNKSFFYEHIAGDMIGNDECEVLYDPDDPTDAIVVGGSTDNATGLWIGLAMFVLGTGAFCWTIFVGDIDF